MLYGRPQSANNLRSRFCFFFVSVGSLRFLVINLCFDISLRTSGQCSLVWFQKLKGQIYCVSREIIMHSGSPHTLWIVHPHPFPLFHEIVLRLYVGPEFSAHPELSYIRPPIALLSAADSSISAGLLIVEFWWYLCHPMFSIAEVWQLQIPCIPGNLEIPMIISLTSKFSRKKGTLTSAGISNHVQLCQIVIPF